MDYSGNEIVWVFLNYIFQPLGFYCFVAVLSVINGIVYYKLIKQYVDKNKRWFAVFIYLFSNAFFSVQLSMLRQGLAMGLVILGYLYLDKRRYVYASVLMLCALVIHTSAIFSLPIVAVHFLDFKNKRLAILTITVCSIAFFVFGDVILSTSVFLLSSNEIFDRYQDKYILGNEYETAGLKNITGMVLLMYPVLMYLIYIRNKKSDPRIRRLCCISIIGILVSFMGQSIPMAGRMAWYYTVFSIAAVPQSFFCVKRKLIRRIVIAVFIIVTLKEYIGFYTSETWSQMHYHYHTLFELLS